MPVAIRYIIQPVNWTPRVQHLHESPQKGVAGRALTMPVKVLKNEGSELRLRLIGEDHATLQLFRSRLNAMDKVEYANYFTGHPDLDEPELFFRVKKGAKADKIIKDLCSDIRKEFAGLSN
jgi:DNA-directed RNA polymerase subunit L